MIKNATWQWVTQWGCLQMVTHFGQSSASHALSGHFIYLSLLPRSQASRTSRRTPRSSALDSSCGTATARRSARTLPGTSGRRTSTRIKDDTNFTFCTWGLVAYFIFNPKLDDTASKTKMIAECFIKLNIIINNQATCFKNIIKDIYHFYNSYL